MHHSMTLPLVCVLYGAVQARRRDVGPETLSDVCVVLSSNCQCGGESSIAAGLCVDMGVGVDE